MQLQHTHDHRELHVQRTQHRLMHFQTGHTALRAQEGAQHHGPAAQSIPTCTASPCGTTLSITPTQGVRGQRCSAHSCFLRKTQCSHCGVKQLQLPRKPGAGPNFGLCLNMNMKIRDCKKRGESAKSPPPDPSAASTCPAYPWHFLFGHLYLSHGAASGVTYSCCAVPCCPQHLSQCGLIEGQAAHRADGEVVGHPIAHTEAPREQRGAGR